MALTAGKSNLRRVKHPRYKWLVTIRSGGTLRKRYFNRREDAADFADAWAAEADAAGTRDVVRPEERSAVLELRADLAEVGLTLRDALLMAIERQRKLSRSATVATLVADYIEAKTKARRSKRYLDDLKSRLGRFTQDFAEFPVAGIESHEISDWLADLRLAPVTTNNYRRLLTGLFNHAVERRFADENPAAMTEKAKEVDQLVAILSPAQAARLLAAAPDTIRPAIAIGAFAGLRPAEIERFDWGGVDLGKGYIHVAPEKSKTARRRLVPIRPNLAAWLEPHAARTGPLWPKNGRKLFEQARADAGIDPWPHDGLRHSFASYHLAAFKNAAELALEMGHESTKLIFKHYREVVTDAEAKEYWGIVPSCPAA
jgi:integrase